MQWDWGSVHDIQHHNEQCVSGSQNFELLARDSTVKTSRLFEWPHSIPTFGSCPIQPRMGHDHFD